MGKKTYLLPEEDGFIAASDDLTAQSAWQDTLPADSDAQHHIAILACGALAHEIMHLLRINQLDHIRLFCLPAKYHITPQKILPRLKQRVAELRQAGFDKIYIGYGDCGTGGMIDQWLAGEPKLERIAGNHCYEFFATTNVFETLAEEELGSFYLTDYLARFFDKLIIEGMWLDKHPELKESYFGNYKRLVYLAQTENEALEEMAQNAAKYLGLDYVRVDTGYGWLDDFVKTAAQS